MYKIPTILSADEVIDKIFHKASKIPEDPKIKNRMIRKKNNVLAKIDTVTDSLNFILNKYVTTFPSFDQVHRFEYELINIIIGIDKLKKSLGAINWGRKKVLKLREEIQRKIKQIRLSSDYPKFEEYRRTFYGRVTSIIQQLSNDLNFLNSTRDKLKGLPSIDPELNTVVVAGFPNVGKSLLVHQLSSAKPKVATYPFTTQQINLGHLMIKHQKVQVIDTPGLLDRSPENRNNIERQAIMALEYLADLIIFVLDPSEHCGYTIEDQLSLFKEIQKLFGNVKIIVIENKVDLKCSESEFLKISALNGQGVDELLSIIQTYILSESI